MTGGLVASTGRSGSKRIVAILDRLGFKATHETKCSFQWAAAMRANLGAEFSLEDGEVESSGHTIFALPLIPDSTRILHQVRRPLDVAASIASSTPGWGPWDSSWIQAENVGMELLPEIHGRPFWLEFWYRYNELVEEICESRGLAILTYRIEDLQLDAGPECTVLLQRIGLHLGMQISAGEAMDALEAIPETYNGTYRQHPDVSWDEAPTNVREMALRYGYEEARSG